ncbi:MAG: calcium/sodium antiporter [Prochlorotrichaceae cyanobacterium]
MNLVVVLSLGIGLVLLVFGAEVLVQGASRLANAWGLSPLIIGLTIVAYGTSAPELAVSLQATWAGEAGLAIGNVIGSNIFNVLCILGISSVITPLVVAQQLIRLDVPLMVLLSILVLMMSWNGNIDRLEGIFLTLGGVAYTLFLLKQGNAEEEAVHDEYAEEEHQWLNKIPLPSMVVNWLCIALGVALLVTGSRFLIHSAISIAEHFGLSRLIIGLTIVATGTSLPELATSVIASVRGKRDIAVGNVIGSNIFNILAVLGIASTFSPNGVSVSEAALHFDIPVMIAVAIACLPIFFTGNLIERWEGLMFLAYYGAYTTYLILDATHHEGLGIFSHILAFFVIPLTVITLATVSWRTWRR